MKIKNIAVEAAAKLLLDNQLWSDVKMFVQDIDGETGMTGTEKHSKVLHDLKIVFADFSNAVLNLAITLAVTWARAQQENG